MKTIALFVSLFFPLTLLHAQTYDTAWVEGISDRLLKIYMAGDYQLCIAENIKALDTTRTVYGAKSLEATEVLFRLGELQKMTGDFMSAEQSATAYLANWKMLLGDRNVQVAMALNQLGYIRLRLEKFDTVEKLLTDSWQMFLELDMNPSYQLCSLASDLATYYEKTGRFLKAEQYFLEALNIARALPDINPLTYGILLNNIALFYTHQHRHDEALRFMDEYLKILESNFDKNHPSYLKARGNKGSILVSAGRYHEATNVLENTLSTARKAYPPGDSQLDYYLKRLATAYQMIGRYEDAVQLREEGFALLKNRYGDAHPNYSANLVSLAEVLHRCNRHARADTLLREAIQIMERDNRTQTIDYAQALIDLGTLDQETQRRPWLEQGAELGRKILGADHPTFYLIFGRPLVRQYLVENQADSARWLLDAVREPIRNAYGRSHRNNIKLETQYGQVWQLKGDAIQSLQHFSAAFAALQENLADNFRFLSVDEREQFARTFEDYRSAFLAAARAFPLDAHFQAFLYDLTLFQKELLASYDRQLLAGWQQNADSTYHRYADVRQMIARQWTLPIAERLDLPELETERTALEKTLAGNLQVSADPDAFHPVQWRQVQQALQAGDAALEWLILPPVREGRDAPCYAVLVLLPGNSAPDLVLLPPTEQVDALFASKGIRGLRYATRTYATDALYRMLWQPLEGRLSGVKRIFYAPTGALHLLNFDAVQGPGGQLLSEKYQLVRVANTARLLDAGFGAGITDIGAVLLAGGLDYEQAAKATPSAPPDLASAGSLWRGGGSTVREWAALPNTLPEVEHLADLFKQKKVQTALLTGPEGTELAVKAHCAAATPGMLHFATHGFFFEKNTEASGSLGLVTAESPMFRTGLILAGANPAWRGDALAPGTGALEDGILTADEISLLPLRNTALVVLSACETGLGDVHDDEGVYGLQRAFRLAGAQNIIMSLWRVPDVQTRDFMEKFYVALLENGDLRGAFQSARQAMRKQYGNPYYWAGFVLLE